MIFNAFILRGIRHKMMKLTTSQIQRLSEKILAQWKSQNLITGRIPFSPETEDIEQFKNSTDFNYLVKECSIEQLSSNRPDISVIEKYLKKGTVKKVRLKKLKVSSDKFDKLDLTYESGDSLSIEVNLTGNVLKRIISKWKIKKKGYFEIPSELQDIGFDGDTSTSITFKDSNGKTTTITSKNNFKASPNFYIPEGVVPRNAIDNLPDLKKLKDYCVGYLNEIKDEIFPVDDDE
jgi:ferredoxin-fold anticodon binding domain-containing protein